MKGKQYPAMLLLGPTGSGKTPLGQLLGRCGLGGRKFVHFDFGETLRAIVACNRPNDDISQGDIDFLSGMLESGVLLENEHFPLAERILRSFLATSVTDTNTWTILNGLPRHVGQAGGVDAILDIRVVACLECSSDVVVQRLANNVGGDRNDRTDDDLNQVCKKIETFRTRTVPLVEHYRCRGVRIETIKVRADMTAEEMRNELLNAPLSD